MEIVGLEAGRSRLGLGTVQFGLDYGISNGSGQVPASELDAILETGLSLGLDLLDTAIAYGDSESRLGRAGVSNWNIVTKLPELDESRDWTARDVVQLVEGSLKRLGQNRLAGLLLHRPEQVEGRLGPIIREGLHLCRKNGLVERLGVSLYDPDDCVRFLSSGGFDMVQVPMNILDRRLEQTGLLDRLRDEGVTVHVRSVFLQGLLLMDKGRRPARFDRWRQVWDLWHNWLETSGLTPLQACIRHALGISGIEHVIVGVTTAAELQNIIAATSGRLPDLPDFGMIDPILINPARWSEL